MEPAPQDTKVVEATPPCKCGALAVLLAICVVILLAVAGYVFLRGKREPQTIPAVRVGSVPPAPAPVSTPPAVPSPAVVSGAEEPVRVGGRYTGTAEELGKKGDGIIRIQGKVVFVEGVRIGEPVEFEVTENLDRFARGRVIGKAAVAPPPSLPSAVADVPPADGNTAHAADVQPGRVFDVLINEADRRQPDRDGVAKIDGLVVFVAESRPDERVRIRVVQRMTRFARAEVVSRLNAPAAAMEASP